MYLHSHSRSTNILLPWIFLNQFFTECTPHETYRVLQEWSEHQRTLMAWPERICVERDDQLQRLRTEFTTIAETIARYEPVWLYVNPDSVVSASSWVLSANITVKVADLEQPWLRQTGPCFAQSTDEKLVGVDLNYASSSSRFSNGHDSTLAARMLRDENIPRIKLDPAFHGAHLEVNEDGILLAAESEILPTGMDEMEARGRVARQLHDTLGLREALFLPSWNHAGTSDNSIIARFAPDSSSVLLSRPNKAIPPSDPAWRIYKSTKQSLTRPRFRVVEIEEAESVPYASVQAPLGGRPSYLGHYLPNGAVIVPQFGDERTDEEALSVLRKLWPKREVVGVNVNMMAWMGGSIRAATVPWPLVGGEEENGLGKEFREDEL